MRPRLSIELYSAGAGGPNYFLSKLVESLLAADGSVAHVDFAGRAVDSGRGNSAGALTPTRHRTQRYEPTPAALGRRDRQGRPSDAGPAWRFAGSGCDSRHRRPYRPRGQIATLPRPVSCDLATRPSAEDVLQRQSCRRFPRHFHENVPIRPAQQIVWHRRCVEEGQHTPPPAFGLFPTSSHVSSSPLRPGTSPGSSHAATGTTIRNTSSRPQLAHDEGGTVLPGSGHASHALGHRHCGYLARHGDHLVPLGEFHRFGAATNRHHVLGTYGRRLGTRRELATVGRLPATSTPAGGGGGGSVGVDSCAGCRHASRSAHSPADSPPDPASSTRASGGSELI